MTLVLQLDRIELTGDKVHRLWEPSQDGTFLYWKKRLDNIWKIARHNECIDKKNRPLTSLEGMPFYGHKHSCTLDDFVLLADSWNYCHIATGFHFTARQINKHIFKDESNWPTRHGYGTRMNPAAWIRRFNRVDSSHRFKAIREAIRAAA